MKRAIFLLSFIAFTLVGQASPPPLKSPVFSDTLATIPGAGDMLDQILAATGLQANFELREADVMNIEAVISHRKRYIYYNASYIDRLNKLAKNKWAAMTLLAHEVGHHLNGHTIRKKGSSPQLELEADEFAGFILHKLGATLEQSQEVMNFIAKAEASGTHPGRQSRMQAIEKGWTRGGDASIAKTH